jgi:hypothetical protein
MENPEKRMDKIAKSLNPKQAVGAWIEEARQSKSMSEYAERTRRPEMLTKRPKSEHATACKANLRRECKEACATRSERRHFYFFFTKT